MRILFASHYALPHIGGIESVIGALGDELRRRGHEVVHVASDADSGAARDDGVIRVPAWNWPERALGVPWPVFGPRLGAALRREVARADVVHAHGALYMSSVGALLLGRHAARVLTEHVGHVAYESPVLDRAQAAAFATLGRAAARSAGAVVVLNEKVEGEMRALAPGRPVVTIRNGVDSERYRPAAPGEREALRRELGWDDRPRVLFVGRLVAKKGVHVALATAAAAQGAFELVLAGPGTVDARGADVRVLGRIDPDDVAPLYRAADAFLLPSRGEGFPVTAQEAMASGLPVVISDDPSYGPWVDGAGAGATLVRPEPRAILERLLPLLGDPAAGAAAADHARREFSWSHAADEHERLYERLRRVST